MTVRCDFDLVLMLLNSHISCILAIEMSETYIKRRFCAVILLFSMILTDVLIRSL